MANVTFTSPSMPRDITVYAVAGDRGTLLSLAKSHNIPIPFDCQEGECGSCLIKVQNLSPRGQSGIALQEKEKEVLRQLGKITQEEIMDAEVNDMPPEHRLACQYFVRNEDILVTFAGDETAPERAPALSIAASVYRGGLSIKSLGEFLNYAVRVEEDAAAHYELLSRAMEECGNEDVAALFRRLGMYSLRHLDEARAKCADAGVEIELPRQSAWPDMQTPEQTDLWAGDANMSRLDALKFALQGERRGYEFYYAVSETSKVRDIRTLAKEFVREEKEHVDTLKLWIERQEAAMRQVG